MKFMPNKSWRRETVLSGKQLPTFQRNLQHHTSYGALVLTTEFFLRNVGVYETTRRHIREGGELQPLGAQRKQ
jgi:hypothetical protein